MTVVLSILGGLFFVAIVGALFVSKEGGSWRLGFKVGRLLRGEASGTGRGANISKSSSSDGGASAIDKTGHSANISETTVKGDLRAEVSAQDEKKKD